MKRSNKNLSILSISVLGILFLLSACGSLQSPSKPKEAKDAVSLVEQLPEVVEYKKTLQDAGSTFHIEAEDSDTSWAVHVFEVVSQGDSSHTATFGWWEVNKTTGEVTKDF